MKCKKCKGTNVIVSSSKEAKRHGLLWWLLLGWNWGLILTILGKKKLVTTAVCQTCGNTWTIK